MKELLIKIRALFEGNGADQAASSLNKVSDAADKAKSSTGNLSGGLGDGAAKAGIFGGAMAAVTGAVINFAEQALSAAINTLKNLVAGFAEGILKVGQLADDLEELSARTGVSTGDLLVLRKAFEDAGIGADAVGPMMNRLQKALAGVNEEGQPTSEALAKLGLSVSSLSTMSGVQQIAAVQDAIMKLPTPAAQAAAAMEIFGRSGGQMLALFKDSGALDAAREKLGSLVDNMVKAGPAMAKFGEAFSEDNINTKKMQFFAAAAVQFSEELEKAGVALNKLDLGPLGQQVGFVVRGAIELTKEINSWVEWFGQFKLLVAAAEGGMSALGGAIRNALDPLNITGFLGYLRDTGREAVQLEERQKAVAEANNTIANSAQIAAQKLAEAQSNSLLLKDESTAAIISATTAGAAKLDNSGQTARQGITTTAQRGSEQIHLTAEQIQQAAQQLAQAFQSGMGQDISPALQALVRAVSANMTQIGAAINLTSQQLAANLNPDLIAAPLQSMTQSVTRFTQTMTTQLSALNASMSGLINVSQQISASASNLQQQLRALQTGVTTLSSSVKSSNLSGLGQELAKLGPVLSQAFQRVEQSNQQVAQAAREGSQNLAKVTAAGVKSISQAVSAAASNLGAAISAAVEAIWRAIDGLQQQIISVASRIR